MASPIDNTYSIIKEVTKGVTPATPAWRYAEVLTGGANLNWNMAELSSDTMNQSRDMSGIRHVAGQGAGTLPFELRRDPVITDLLQSAFSASLAGSKYTGSNVDSTFTIEECQPGETGKLYWRYKNAVVNKATISVAADAKAQATFDYTSGVREHGTAIVTGATYAKTVKGKELTGLDVGTITIAGLSARFMSIELTVEQAREANFAVGERDAFEIATGTNRVVKLTAKVYRKDLTPETLFIPDTPVAVTFAIGATGAGYSFDLPACVGGVPQNEISGTKQLVNLTLTAQYDPTAGYAAAFSLI